MSYIVCGSCCELITSTIHVCKGNYKLPSVTKCNQCESLKEEVLKKNQELLFYKMDKELCSIYELKEKNEKMEEQLALCVEALDYIRKISYNEGFKIYRNDEDLVKATLDKLAAMQKEQKGE